MSNKKLNKLKEELLRLSRRREKLLQMFFSQETLIRGSYIETRIRCSSPGCHCHDNDGHPTVRISRWDHGKIISRVVRIPDRDWVANAAANYKAHKQAIRDISSLNTQEKGLLKKLIEEKAKNYE